MDRRRGFTLIEVLVVLVIIGVLSAAVALRLWEPLQEATLDDVAGQFLMLDRITRLHARHTSAPVKLVFVVGGTQASRQEGQEQEKVQPLRLARGWTIERFWTGGQFSSGGEATVEFSRQAWSRTYALQVHGPAAQEQWLIFAGMSGQLTKVSDAKQAEAILQALPPAGSDAH